MLVHSYTKYFSCYSLYQSSFKLVYNTFEIQVLRVLLLLSLTRGIEGMSEIFYQYMVHVYVKKIIKILY